MDVRWTYLVPAWQMALLILAAMALYSVAMLLLTRRAVREPAPGHNEFTGHIFATAGAVYAVLLALIAVAVWQVFREVDVAVSTEACTCQELAIDAGGYPEPWRSEIHAAARAYLAAVITEEWPEQQRGVSLDTLPSRRSGAAPLVRLCVLFNRIEPKTEAQRTVHAEVLARLNELIHARRNRITNAEVALPPMMWAVILLGAGINILFACLLHYQNFRVKCALVLMLAGLLGLVIFLIHQLDHPLWGSTSPSVAPFEHALMLVQSLLR